MQPSHLSIPPKHALRGQGRFLVRRHFFHFQKAMPATGCSQEACFCFRNVRVRDHLATRFGALSVVDWIDGRAPRSERVGEVTVIATFLCVSEACQRGQTRESVQIGLSFTAVRITCSLWTTASACSIALPLRPPVA